MASCFAYLSQRNDTGWVISKCEHWVTQGALKNWSTGRIPSSEEVSHEKHPTPWRIDSRETSGPLKNQVTETSIPLKNWVIGNLRYPEEQNQGRHSPPWITEARGIFHPLKNWVTGNIQPLEDESLKHPVPWRTKSRKHPVLWRTESQRHILSS
jgi:hypothetical protein